MATLKSGHTSQILKSIKVSTISIVDDNNAFITITSYGMLQQN